MRHAKNTIKLGPESRASKFAVGKPGLQPHRVESNQDDLGKGEGGPSLCWKDDCTRQMARSSQPPRGFCFSAPAGGPVSTKV